MAVNVLYIPTRPGTGTFPLPMPQPLKIIAETDVKKHPRHRHILKQTLFVKHLKLLILYKTSLKKKNFGGSYRAFQVRERGGWRNTTRRHQRFRGESECCRSILKKAYNKNSKEGERRKRERIVCEGMTARARYRKEGPKSKVQASAVHGMVPGGSATPPWSEGLPVSVVMSPFHPPPLPLHLESLPHPQTRC